MHQSNDYFYSFPMFLILCFAYDFLYYFYVFLISTFFQNHVIFKEPSVVITLVIQQVNTGQ